MQKSVKDKGEQEVPDRGGHRGRLEFEIAQAKLRLGLEQHGKDLKEVIKKGSVVKIENNGRPKVAKWR